MSNEPSVQRMAEAQADVALLIIDVQKGLFDKPTPIYRADELLKKIRFDFGDGNPIR